MAYFRHRRVVAGERQGSPDVCGLSVSSPRGSRLFRSCAAACTTRSECDVSAYPRTPPSRRALVKTITKKDLIDQLAEYCNCKGPVAKDAVDSLLHYVATQIAAGSRIEIRDYLIVDVVIKPAHIAHNPRTLEKFKVPEKRVVRIKAGRALREAVEKGTPPSNRKGKRGDVPTGTAGKGAPTIEPKPTRGGARARKPMSVD